MQIELTPKDLAAMAIAAAAATHAWNAAIRRDKTLVVPGVLIGVHRPSSFPKEMPAEIFVTSNDQSRLKFFATEAQTFAAAESVSLAETPDGKIRYYRIRQGPADEEMYGPRSPLRPLLCETDGTGGLSDPKILFAMRSIAPIVFKTIPEWSVSSSFAPGDD